MQSQLDSAIVEELCLALALDEWPPDMSDCTVTMLRDDCITSLYCNARTFAGEERYLCTPLADVIEEPCFSLLGNAPQLYKGTDLFLYKLYLKLYFFLSKTGYGFDTSLIYLFLLQTGPLLIKLSFVTILLN